MSHEIETAVFMASEGAGWTGLGRAIPLHLSKDPRAIAELCNALWTVQTEPTYRKTPAGFVQVPDTALQVRSDNGHVLSVTSEKRYHTVNRQPVDIFEAFRDDLAQFKLDISHAAVLRGGAVIAVSAVLPGDNDVIVGRGDRVKSYVTLSTGYDTKHGTKATKGSIRVVCANTLAYSIEEATRTGKIRTVRASTRLEAHSLRELIRNLDDIVKAERRTFDALANARMSEADVARYFADVLEINIEDLNKTDRAGKPVLSTKSRNMLAALTDAYRTAPGAAVATGTAWGALNAVTYYATHQKTCRDTCGDGVEITRIASNMTGDAAALKASALAILAKRYADTNVPVAVAA